jgi:glycosyltransferase involved in cell wall biosynthesis
VHQLNMTGFREPGYLWKLDAPFVWGPIGGAADIPPAFFPLMSRQDRLFYRLRNFLNGVQKRTSCRCRAAARRAARIWAIGEANRRMAADRWGCEAELLLESGAVERAGVAPKVRRPGEPLRLVWSGLHIGRKALPVLLHALARLDGEPRVELAVLGEGPETGRWKALAQELGVATRVRWTDMLPLEAALAEVSRADVLAFTSVQEGTPHAVLEALSLALPVVCHDACGMGAAVTGECGIKVRMHSPETSVAGFADAIRKVALDADLFHRLSAGALRRAAELSWDAKAKQIALTYEQVVSAAARRNLTTDHPPLTTDS